MPLKEYLCRDCTQIWEEYIQTQEDEPLKCLHCESPKIEKRLSSHGGYQINGSNGASSRPKSSGSFKRSK